MATTTASHIVTVDPTRIAINPYVLEADPIPNLTSGSMRKTLVWPNTNKGRVKPEEPGRIIIRHDNGFH